MANDRDCENCKHKVNGACNVWDCVFESCEPVRNPDQLDCISRQAVIGACDQSINLFEAVDRIKELPPVNPQKPICPSAGVDCEDCPAYEKKSEWQHDHEILKAYSDGANEVLDKIRAEIEGLKPCQGCFYDGITRCLEIIDEYKAEGSGEE